jgi:hypothetical protein
MNSDGKALFGRAYSLVVAPTDNPLAFGLDVSDLRCTFKGKKSLKAEPNTCEVKVWGLAESSRKLLEEGEKLVVRLEAGYVSTGTSQLFLGEVRAASTEWDGPDCITTITTGDSEKEMQEARIHYSVGPSVPVDIAMTAIAKALKVGAGNLAQAIATLKTKGVAAMFGPGTVISGNAARELTDFCRSAGLEWSIQDGSLQILDAGKALEGLAVQLSSSSGLIGSPVVDFNASSKTKKGGTFVKAKCLLIPELAPGRKVVFDSRLVSGGFRIEEVEYQGDTHGDDWFAIITAKTY